MCFTKDCQVRHPRFGVGRVRAVDEKTAIVRFDHGIEECFHADLEPVASALRAAEAENWHPPLEVLTRFQAEAIRSVSDAWSVLSRAPIRLLPHQLWVCRQVLQTWPTRWLVADDVGLGKTIEAGLILMPLISRGTVRRLLILCPASLVGQWQQRLYDFFDIRMGVYATENDGLKVNYWQITPQVVASLQTLRKDSRERQKRLLEADPWDLVIVDEAHHLNAEEQEGATLGYQLIEKLQQAGKVRSLLFFSGTPHRGKNYNFLALLRLLRSDLFDPARALADQLGRLPQVLIRNNKQAVTDLQGQRLFQAPLVRAETYRYTPTEANFYNLMTHFIETGKAYAQNLEQTEGKAVKLVLIALQKLASSSVAAIRRALRNRRDRLRQGRARAEKGVQPAILANRLADLDGEGDEASVATEQVVDQLSWELRLMRDEEARLDELLAVAETIQDETKICKVLDLLDGPFQGRSVLLFTEYKATQASILEALSHRYGSGSVVFINGEEAVEAWTDGGRHPGRRWVLKRGKAAEDFNAGKVRFLVSTEAGGEGIDLQERCYSLIHVDLPWNPMRLHQRVGRLNRLGQTRRVEVYSLRNPETVETLIWDHLNHKLEQIQLALAQVMEEPEDLLQLVLGMTSPSLFRELFADAPGRKESVAGWFDARTARFGEQDVLEAVRDLVGNCARFDFQYASPLIPRIDLPDLRPFFKAMVTLNGHRVTETDGEISFITPESWAAEPGIKERYQGLVFDRQRRGSDAAQRVLGVGHKLVDLALRQALDRQATVALLPKSALPYPLFVYRVTDQITGTDANVRGVVLAVEVERNGTRLLRDWELLLRLNQVLDHPNVRLQQQPTPQERVALTSQVNLCEAFAASQLPSLQLPFQAPHLTLLGTLWPR